MSSSAAACSVSSSAAACSGSSSAVACSASSLSAGSPSSCSVSWWSASCLVTVFFACLAVVDACAAAGRFRGASSAEPRALPRPLPAPRPRPLLFGAGSGIESGVTGSSSSALPSRRAARVFFWACYDGGIYDQQFGVNQSL